MRRRVTTLGLVMASALSGCVWDNAGGAQCTVDNHCVSNGDGSVECETGYVWEDEDDPDNYRCVPEVPGADAGA